MIIKPIVSPWLMRNTEWRCPKSCSGATIESNFSCIFHRSVTPTSTRNWYTLTMQMLMLPVHDLFMNRSLYMEQTVWSKQCFDKHVSKHAPYAHLHWHYLSFHRYQELSAMAHGHSRHKLHLCGMSSQNLSIALTLSITSRSRWKLTFSTSITSIMTDLWSILCF